MGRTLGVIFAALVLAGAAGATGSAPRATVTITDTGISPPRVRVDARGTVTWRNTGRAAHRVASSNRAFTAFTLAPGARRAVRFTRNGRHPYTVDGRRCGVVFVGVALGAGCTVGGSAPPPPTGTRTYTYDVTLRFMLKNEGFIDDRGRRTDEWTREYTWTSTVRNFKFKVTSYAGTNFIGLNAVGRAVRATAQFVDRYDYFWYPHNPEFFPPNADCEGTASGAVPIGFFAAVGHPTTPNVKVHAQLDLPGWDKDEEFAANCNGWTPRDAQEGPPIRLPDGTVAEGDNNLHSLDFERRTGGRRTPAGELAVGRAFTLDSGVRVTQQPLGGGETSGTLTITERYVATFRPRR